VSLALSGEPNNSLLVCGNVAVPNAAPFLVASSDRVKTLCDAPGDSVQHLYHQLLGSKKLECSGMLIFAPLPYICLNDSLSPGFELVAIPGIVVTDRCCVLPLAGQIEWPRERIEIEDVESAISTVHCHEYG
jgi:hypothetical protein